jgi:hypothetical protein
MKEFSDLEKANISFLGNSLEFYAQIEELKSYLTEIHEYIEVTNIHLQNERIKGYSKTTLEKIKYHYKYTHGDILRKSIIISSIILLESGIDIYCRDFKENKKIKIGYKDLKGDLLDRFKFYSQKILDSTFSFNSQLWSDIVGLYEVRNCLIHNNGSIKYFSKKKVIEEFIKRNDVFEIDEDDFIKITHQACNFGLKTIEKFYSGITEFAFECFPDL